METSLHRELKRLYAGPDGRTEVRLGRFRVDAVVGDEHGELLIEIQHSSLWAIRDKIQRLCRQRRVRLVKPIVGRKRLIYCSRAGGSVIKERNSPRRGRLLEIFDELVYFTRTFPHKNLSLELVLVDIEEWRIPPVARNTRRRHRPQWQPQYSVEDQKLVAVRETVRISRPADLVQLLSCNLPVPFHTADLATGLSIPRWTAQRMAYVLRKTGAAKAIGKKRGAWLYEWCDARARRRAA